MTTFHEDLFFKEMQPYRPEGVEKGPLNICLESNPMMETYGEDYKAVLAFDPIHVWTLVDVDGHLYIASGLHWVNRVGYYLTRRPHYGAFLEFRMGDVSKTMTERGYAKRLVTLNRLIETARTSIPCQP